MRKLNPKTIKPGGVATYIAKHPKKIQTLLRSMREAIREAVPDAVETVSYFEMPGYSYEGYGYNGMFAWFSFKEPFIRLHVRPNALVKHRKDLVSYAKTKAIVHFPMDKKIPKALVKRLIKASVKDMIEANAHH
jgi:uncharacterized protein YdhG (YjbR/CyaY superfamily)